MNRIMKDACILSLVFVCIALFFSVSRTHAQTENHRDHTSTNAMQDYTNTILQPETITVDAKSGVLMDADTGQILIEYNKDDRVEPASFAKLLTLYIVFESIHHGKLALDDEIFVSKKAWKTGGSRMFIEVNSKVPLEEIIKGISVVSGNDACVAVAEHLYGSTDVFVKIMNETAQKIGMKDSYFRTPHGLPRRQEQYTTAHDMALLAKNYIQNFPEALQFHSMLEYTYANIKQPNRNGLLRKDPSVDGLKTGYTAEAGYHLLASAKREGRRLIAVVMGAESRAVREREARKLLNYGYQNFELLSLFTKNQVLAEVPVWKGARNTVSLVASDYGVLTVPIAQKTKIQEHRDFPSNVTAPIYKGQVIGTATITFGADILKSVPLIARNEVKKAGIFKFLSHSIYLVGIHNVHIFILLIAILFFSSTLYMFVLRKRKKRRSGFRF